MSKQKEGPKFEVLVGSYVLEMYVLKTVGTRDESEEG